MPDADRPAGPAHTPGAFVPPPLPIVWRPQRVRAFLYATGAVVVAVLTVIAVLLPGEGHGAWGLGSRVAMVAVGIAVAGVLALIARPRVVADDHGVTVVNIIRTRRLEWPEIVQVTLRPGDPWAFLDLTDGETLAMMGIQNSSGEQRHARRAVMQLRALVTERTRTERND
jgi:hypothetical protein